MFRADLSVVWLPQGQLWDWRGGSLTQPMFITALFLLWPEGHWEPRNEGGSQNPAKHIGEVRIGIFLILSVNALSYFAVHQDLVISQNEKYYSGSGPTLFSYLQSDTLNIESGEVVVHTTDSVAYLISLFSLQNFGL